MKRLFCLLAVASIVVYSCGDNNSQQATETTTDSSTVHPATDWNFGVALWTFQTVDFADALMKVDSAGLKYIEPNTFHKSCPQLKVSILGQLSPAGLDTVKALIAKHGLKVESIYIVGDSTIQSWVKQFNI